MGCQITHLLVQPVLQCSSNVVGHGWVQRQSGPCSLQGLIDGQGQLEQSISESLPAGCLEAETGGGGVWGFAPVLIA